MVNWQEFNWWNVQECKLITGGFAIVVQMLLGAMALLSLFIKRHRERPQRPLDVWLLDALKQCLAAGIAHVANIGIAVFIADYAPHSDECAFYFINGTVDTTLGITLVYFLLRSMTRLAFRFHWTSLQTPGKYGDPVSLRIWRLQLFGWLLIVLSAKATMGLLIFSFRKPLEKIGSAVFAPIEPYPRVELVFVMLLCPAVMNIVQFWIQDNFIKYNRPKLLLETAPLLDESADQL